ncbi:unnamed protein product [marine sediment metagenome]|uniref:Uncharacterized protein n=1 Tax=marine sediment metagenome TaxID=412755 RepID=X1I151_9ZZZZ
MSGIFGAEFAFFSNFLKFVINIWAVGDGIYIYGEGVRGK